MATVALSLHTSGIASSVSSQDTAVVTLTAGRVYYLYVGNSIDIATPTLPTVSGWTQIGTVTAAWDLTRLTLFRKVGDGSEVAQTIDFAAVEQARVQWAMEEATDANTTTPEVAGNNKTGTASSATPTVTFDAFADATNNAGLFGFFVQNPADTATEEVGWTEDFLEASNYRMGVIWKSGGADLTPSWTIDPSMAWRGVGCEIASSAAPTTGGGGAYYQHYYLSVVT